MDSVPTSESQPNSLAQEDAQPKRRACDECRARKLACSKEPDGCARCKREKIRCHYSPQKPMGRPRKRAHVETEDAAQQPAQQPARLPEQQLGQQPNQQNQQPGQQELQTQPQMLFPPQDHLPLYMPPDSATFGMDLDMSFLDVGGNDLNFIDLLGPDFATASVPMDGLLDPAPKHGNNNGGGSWPLAGTLGDISFDSVPMEPMAQPNQTEDITQDPLAQFMSTPDMLEQLPSLSPASSHSTHHATPPDTTVENPEPCGCGTALFLAMNSLRALPKEVGQAMRVARLAAKTAHDTILCGYCSNVPIEMSHNPPVECIQNMMMLGALLPTISGAYTRILAMVDSEASKADAERRKITFSLLNYGGIWGQVAQDTQCGASASLEGVVLEPSMWRLTVRALLRFDVYGLNEKQDSGVSMCSMVQPGLKDIIGMMEERSRGRHEQLDAMVAAGTMDKPDICLYVPLSSTTDKPTCLRIIDIAKKSIDDLVIP